MYITHPTHGAGARPGKTQPPTANRKNNTECQPVRAPAQGRQREEQADPPKKQKKTTGGGGGENGQQPPGCPPTPQEAAKPPTQTAPKTGPPKGAPGDHPSKTSNTKRRAAAHWEKGHPKHADTHHAGKKKHKQQTTRPGREAMGGQRPRDPRRRQPATDSSKPKKKPPKWRGGAKPHQRQHPHTPAPQAAPQEGRGKAGHTHDSTHTPTTPPQGEVGCSRNPVPNTHAHTAHQNREWRGAGGARTQPRTSQNPNQDRRGAGRNPSPTANTANPSGEKRGETTNRTKTVRKSHCHVFLGGLDPG